MLIFLALHIWGTWRGFKQIQKDYQLSALREEGFKTEKKRFVLNKNNKILVNDLERLLPFVDISVQLD